MSRYEEIANEIIEKIRAGIYKSGNPLPDQKTMAKEYATSRMTLQKSLAILKTRGYVYSQQGAATYVKSNADSIANMSIGVDQYVGTSQLMGQEHKVVSKIIKFELRYPNKDEMRDLRIKETDAIYNIKRLRLVDGNPYALEYTKMPVNVIPGVNEKVLHSSIYGYIQSELKLTIGAADRTINAEKPSADDLKYLKAKTGEPILNVRQVVYLDDGTPFESSSTDRPYNTGGYRVFLSHKADL
ncbi:GntR family transcriptional regulator [Companilactobacillus suantsaicola]|uniref:GntR family transcriptional regulator n=1 Tax=Companilactobacillus suantsaicola TaxID=2487723 RepID=A0A4Z0JP52_9LACO|nr:GntR family transcriptional regulator [Companilactobacillus suantsaicola]TGD23980.1 GntR family transcriptional regulator [Companilactobacillus suantsaicola]